MEELGNVASGVLTNDKTTTSETTFLYKIRIRIIICIYRVARECSLDIPRDSDKDFVRSSVLPSV